MILAGAAALVVASPAASAEPTKGNVYALEFEVADTPSTTEQPESGRYCGRWMNNGTKNAVILFKFRREKTVMDLPEGSREGTVCNTTMESFYRQADASIRQTDVRYRPPPPFIHDPFRHTRMMHMHRPMMPGTFKKK